MDLRYLAATLVVLASAGCGTRQPVEEVPPPEPVVPGIRTCPSPEVGPNHQITSSVGESRSPVISWGGGAFALAWWTMSGRFQPVFDARVDRDGVVRSPSRQITHGTVGRELDVSFDGSETHLAWLDDGAAASARLTAGEPAVKRLGPDSTGVASAPWGAAAWVRKGNLLFRCDGMIPPPDRSGARPEPEPVVLYQGGIEDPRIAWSGEHYAVVWSSSVRGGREILLQRVTPKGRKVGEAVKVSATAGISRGPQISWTGDAYAVAWTNADPSDSSIGASHRIFFALVPALAKRPSMTRKLELSGTAERVALASTGAEHGLAWVGDREPMGSAIYFQRLDAKGELVGDTVEVTDGTPIACGRPSLAWAGDGYGVAWDDNRGTVDSEVYFAFLRCGEEEVPDAGVPGDAGAPTDGGVPIDAGAAEGAGSDAEGSAPSLKKVF